MTIETASYLATALMLTSLYYFIKGKIADSEKTAFMRGEAYARKCIAGVYDNDVIKRMRIDAPVTLENRIAYLQSMMDEASYFGEKSCFDLGISAAIVEHLELS